MIYYELYGLPGAGKTTVTSSLVDKLKADGYKVAERKDVYHRRGLKLGSISAYLEMLFHPSEYKLFWFYLMLYLKCRQKNLYHFEQLLFYSHQILMTNKEGEYDMMFLDEGVIQFISSLFYLEDCPIENQIGRISKYFSGRINITPIFCSVDIHESMKRIKERPYFQKARFSHSVGTEKLEMALRHKIHNLKVIASYFPNHYEINMADTVQQNVDLLRLFVNQRIIDKKNKKEKKK